MKPDRTKTIKRHRENLGMLTVLKRLIQSAEERTLAALAGQEAVAAAGDPCPDKSDPSTSWDIYFCQLNARARYLLGETNCQEYCDEHDACTPSSG